MLTVICKMCDCFVDHFFSQMVQPAAPDFYERVRVKGNVMGLILRSDIKFKRNAGTDED